jgi:FKBP-type peptidyl-prolyl cis-trans isomerase SlyD
MKAQIVSFHCVLKNALGQVISTSYNRDVITQLPNGAPMEVPGLSLGLKEVKPGERRKIAVNAKEAYGMYDPALTREASRKSLLSTEPPAVGDRVHMATSFGDFRLYRITKILGDLIYLDANHPLAGQDLVFEVQVVDARDATEEEIQEASAPAVHSYLH